MGCYPAFLGYFCLRLPPSQHLEKLTDFRLFIFAVHLYIAPTVGKECIYFQSCRELSYSERSSDLAPKTAMPVQAPLWSNVRALRYIKGSYPAAGLTNVVRSTQGIQREQNIRPWGQHGTCRTKPHFCCGARPQHISVLLTEEEDFVIFIIQLETEA